MNFYKILNKQIFSSGNYSLVPIRMEDRFDIMKWRNEQIYHLRQSEPLTEEMQNIYFANVVSKLFEQDKPSQLLFSYLENGKCIGYGGLVHINWIDRNAEISFIMDTSRERTEFHKHWGIYLELLEQIAFDELCLHKIYTYAFDLRPHLYEAIEAKGYTKEAILKEHCLFDGVYKDVMIHSKINQHITIRNININDKEITFEWTNDKITRDNSFNSQSITFEEHSAWFERKLNDKNATYFICEVENKPASIVRFDKADEKVVIGITIAPAFRGKKLAALFLQKSCIKYLDETNADHIYAYIKKNNKASIKSFEKAGFLYNKTLEISNYEALEYIYERK
ncbi:MAG: GNAT family N-acetyltransferase [Paludibacter sp.]